MSVLQDFLPVEQQRKKTWVRGLDTDYNCGAAAWYNMENTANKIKMLVHDSVIKVATHAAQYSTAFELIRQDASRLSEETAGLQVFCFSSRHGEAQR
jgi:hypothetical protein